jgi:hypothetical protein
MTRAALRILARLVLSTERGRRLLVVIAANVEPAELAATADDETAFALLERLAARFNARLEIRE